MKCGMFVTTGDEQGSAIFHVISCMSGRCYQETERRER